jgi:hypothetical protein
VNILQAKSDHLNAGLVIALAGEDADYADDLAQNVVQAWLGVDFPYGAPLGYRTVLCSCHQICPVALRYGQAQGDVFQRQAALG